MNRKSLFFSHPGRVEVLDEPLEEPADGRLLVRTLFSAISSGTEMLAYGGRLPEEMPLDANLPALQGTFRYPFKYGYALVGEVVSVGNGLSQEWLGRRVFSFHPHESAFTAAPGDVIPVPQGLDVLDALFLPNMETAVNLVQDGRPIIGEMVAVWGLGVVGLLTAALLAQFPLKKLAAFDRFEKRRQAALEMGVLVSQASEGGLEYAPGENLFHRDHPGYDLAYELSGSPAALDQAIALTGFDGRVVIGSWYGKAAVPLSLGGAFHRSRIRLLSSQVSTVSPELSGRWSKPRRFEEAWRQLVGIRPKKWITHVYPFEQAGAAYKKIAENPEETIQVILEYS